MSQSDKEQFVGTGNPPHTGTIISNIYLFVNSNGGTFTPFLIVQKGLYFADSPSTGYTVCMSKYSTRAAIYTKTAARDIVASMRAIYARRRSYAYTALLVVIFACIISVFNNWGQLVQTFGYSISGASKLAVAGTIILNFYTSNLSGIMLFVHFLLALLLAINTQATAYYITSRSRAAGSTLVGSSLVRSSLGTALGSALALIGSGCAACSGVLLTFGLTTLGGGLGASIAPYAGEWVLALAVALVLYSLYLVLRNIQKPFTC
jgi:hypothetical protein